VSYDPRVLPPDLPAPEDDGACAHLHGLALPDIWLFSTAREQLNLARLGGVLVAYFFPRMGDPRDGGAPPGWDETPGARGCTPQSCAFRDHEAELAALGARIVGVSVQPVAELEERVERLGLPFPLLGDPDRRIAAVLGLPTFTFDGAELYKRVTLLARDGVVERVFYPVFPPDRSAAEVVDYLRSSATP
jgi:peroxiredoxin